MLKKYIAYSRARCSPKLTDEAAEELVSRYQIMRRDGRERKVVVATPRQLESFIRISESLARMRLDDKVRRPLLVVVVVVVVVVMLLQQAVAVPATGAAPCWAGRAQRLCMASLKSQHLMTDVVGLHAPAGSSRRRSPRATWARRSACGTAP